MMQQIKRTLIGTITGALLFLASSAPVFAQNPINVCPTNPPFDRLCSLFQGPDIFGRIVGLIISVLLIAAVIVSIIFLIWGGIRWILSGGDKAGVENARNTIIAAIIGLVISLAAFFIINIIGQILGIQLFNLTVPSLNIGG